ncbi:hypothetical protein ACHAXS_000787 [Conticribra weissflogii]
MKIYKKSFISVVGLALTGAVQGQGKLYSELLTTIRKLRFIQTINF